MLTPEQCRAARGLLGWDKLTLAEKSAISIVTLSKFEAGKRSPYRGTLTMLRQCLEAAGIIFIDRNGGGAGVRLRV